MFKTVSKYGFTVYFDYTKMMIKKQSEEFSFPEKILLLDNTFTAPLIPTIGEIIYSKTPERNHIEIVYGFKWFLDDLDNFFENKDNMLEIMDWLFEQLQLCNNEKLCLVPPENILSYYELKNTLEGGVRGQINFSI